MSPQIVNDDALLQRIYRLRWQMLTQLGVPKAVYPSGLIHDPQDSIGTHYAILSDDDILASARFSMHATVADLPSPRYFTSARDRLPTPIGSMNRLFVVPAARRHGYATQLDEARLDEAQRRHCGSVVLVVHQFSGAARLRAALSQGFECLCPVNSVPDPLWGGFGTPLFKRLR